MRPHKQARVRCRLGAVGKCQEAESGTDDQQAEKQDGQHGSERLGTAEHDFAATDAAE